jgi:hypothetical protein
VSHHTHHTHRANNNGCFVLFCCCCCCCCTCCHALACVFCPVAIFALSPVSPHSCRTLAHGAPNTRAGGLSRFACHPCAAVSHYSSSPFQQPIFVMPNSNPITCLGFFSQQCRRHIVLLPASIHLVLCVFLFTRCLFGSVVSCSHFVTPPLSPAPTQLPFATISQSAGYFCCFCFCLLLFFFSAVALLPTPPTVAVQHVCLPTVAIAFCCCLLFFVAPVLPVTSPQSPHNSYPQGAKGQKKKKKLFAFQICVSSLRSFEQAIAIVSIAIVLSTVMRPLMVRSRRLQRDSRLQSPAPVARCRGLFTQMHQAHTTDI